MRGMDGLRVAHDIRKRAEFGTATILMLKSGGAPGEAREARRAGIATCLFKPFKQSELLAAILKALNKAVPADAGHGTGTPLGVEGTSQPLRSAGPRPNARRVQRRFSASCHNRFPETDKVSPVLPVSSRVPRDVASPLRRCGAISACGNAGGHASPRSPEVRERWLPIEELLSERSGRQRRTRTIDPGNRGQPDARDVLEDDIHWLLMTTAGTGSTGFQLLTYLAPGSRGAKGKTLPGQSTLKWSCGFSDE